MERQKNEQQSILKFAELGFCLQPFSNYGYEFGIQEGDMSPDDLNAIFPRSDSKYKG